MKYRYTYNFRMSDGSKFQLYETSDTYISEEQLVKTICKGNFICAYLPNTTKVHVVNMAHVATLYVDTVEEAS